MCARQHLFSTILACLLTVLVVSFSLPTFLVPPAEAAENSWATMADMPKGLFPEVAVVNGKIYVITDYYNYEYNPATDTWTAKKPLPTRRDSFGIAVYQNKIYAIGGKRGENLATNEVYDPVTDTWETKTPMPTKRAYLDANTVNGKIYLIGGASYYQMPPFMVEYNETQVYDPSTDSWTTKAPIPTPSGDYASAVVDNRIYVIAGGGSPSSRNQIYDTETNTWTTGKSLPTAICFAAAAATSGVAAPKRIYVIGGGTRFSLSTGLVQVYDPEGDTWKMGTSMPTPRFGLAVAVVNDLLYAIGGSLSPGMTGINEQYTPFGYETVPPPDANPPFPTTWIAAAIVVIAAVGATLLVYFAKVKKTTGKTEIISEGAK
jgi:N-acetylneuraminic acid mutarotase